MFQEDWVRDLKMQASKMLVRNGQIICLERTNSLSRIDGASGFTIWEVKVNYQGGWIAIFEEYIFYKDKNQILKIIAFDSGKLIDEIAFLHTSSCVHYNNIIIPRAIYNSGNWISKPFKTEKNINWDTIFKRTLGEWNLIIGNVGNKVYALDTMRKFMVEFDFKSGAIENTINIPKRRTKFYSIDIQADEVSIISIAESGIINVYNGIDNAWREKIKHTCNIISAHITTLPSQYIFVDEENYLCSYDKGSGRMRWKKTINHRGRIASLELGQNKTLIGVCMFKKSIISNTGELEHEMKSERKIRSNFFPVRDGFVFFRKSRLVKYRKIEN